MVLMRWAMVRTVQCLNSRRMVFWIRESVAASTLAVASSATSTRGWRSNARPTHSSWRWPTLKFSPAVAQGQDIDVTVSSSKLHAKHIHLFQVKKWRGRQAGWLAGRQAGRQAGRGLTILRNTRRQSLGQPRHHLLERHVAQRFPELSISVAAVGVQVAAN